MKNRLKLLIEENERLNKENQKLNERINKNRYCQHCKHGVSVPILGNGLFKEWEYICIFDCKCEKFELKEQDE